MWMNEESDQIKCNNPISSLLSVAKMDLYATNPGPIDDSVLYDQDKHVSASVWEGQERGALRCHEHTSKLDQWTLTSKQVELVNKAGFGYLRLIPAISLDNPLISALVERWRRETNTFHLTVGEMTVTLEDVAYLLGLAIDGEPVIGVTYTTCEAVCVKFLGKAPDSGYTSGGMVKLSWLKETFSQCPEDAAIEDIERHTRAYLLYLVGSTIFSTTTGNKVPVMYLPLFENFDQAGKYAWGAAALSFLYRALGNASLKAQSTISGCLTLLQCWSYYHLTVGRPKLNHDPIHDSFPFVLKWKGKHSGPTANRDVAFYRKSLDTLKPAEVEWRPYTNFNQKVIPQEMKNILNLGRSKTMLICFDKAERHLPDRCLRQYGIQQTIPEDVPRWERKSRGVDGGIDLSGKMESELSEWSNRRLHIVDSDEDVDESEYMRWYLRITRKLVGRPIPISSEFQRMNAALRDIAHLVDTLSTHGMDDQQIYSVTRIRYIAHECLSDQVGSSITVNSENELGKRVRGKERVRRKGMGKRKRRDDPEEYNVAGEDAQSQLCDTTMELEAVEVDHSRLCPVHDEIEHSLICLPPADGDGAQPCDPASTVHDSQLCHVANNVDDSHFRHAAKRVDNNQPSLAPNECDSQPSHAPTEVVPQSSLETSNEVARKNDYGVLV
ncbi:protein MAIN-LIKE 2-like [Actinidia eriantha]|uniref:protein MAIN-LIKE 2-like n=1 Tax=Actinidia eriantha TaxID=165200 RepID=UPI0025826238|nr:protein MAIN-LIKE 2-like [Actinidia eriantha]